MKGNHSCAGVTLLEVLMVMALMTTATLGLLSLHQQMKVQAHLALQWQQAEQLASEQLTLWQKDALLQGTEFVQHWHDGERHNGVFSLSWTMTEPLVQGIYVVQLDVRWQDSQQQPHLLTFRMVYRVVDSPGPLPITRISGAEDKKKACLDQAG